jgi:hypothetical protein
MTRVRLKYLHCFNDRHGKPHCYFRYRGQQWRLPAPGTEGFAAAYDSLLARIKAFCDTRNVEFMPGSLGWAIEKFLASPLYNKRADTTKRSDTSAARLIPVSRIAHRVASLLFSVRNAEVRRSAQKSN